MENKERVGDFLTHYGILGMKWGVRNPETIARYARDGRSKLTAGIRRTLENRKLKKQINKDAKKAKKGDYSSFTDAELREKINRINLERQYRDLNKTKLQRGKDVANDVLKTSAKGAAVGYTTKVISDQIKKIAEKKIS